MAKTQEPTMADLAELLVGAVVEQHRGPRAPIYGTFAHYDGKRITVCELRTPLGDETLTVNAVAKTCPEDEPDRLLGNTLAFSRALQRLGRKLERRALGETKQRDHRRR